MVFVSGHQPQMTNLASVRKTTGFQKAKGFKALGIRPGCKDPRAFGLSNPFSEQEAILIGRLFPLPSPTDPTFFAIVKILL